MTDNGKTPPRPSMAVSVENTKNLRAKFEQLQVVSNSGNAVRNRRGYTLPNNTTAPDLAKQMNSPQSNGPAPTR